MEENRNESCQTGKVKTQRKRQDNPDGRTQAAIWLALLAGFPFAYGCWGLFTEAGHEKYDEMDGMIPLAYLLGAAALVMASAEFAVIALVRRRRSS